MRRGRNKGSNPPRIPRNDRKKPALILERVQKARLEVIRKELRHSNNERVLHNLSHAADYDDLETDVGEDDAGASLNRTLSSKRAFGTQLRKAIAESDVVIEVLDARDPSSFRSSQVEQEVLTNGKVLVLLLNKIDLIDDQTVVERWQHFLQRSHPCVVFRSMTTGSRTKKSSVKFNAGKATRAPAAVLESGYQPLGATDLMNLLKNYTRSDHETEAAPPPSEAMGDEAAVATEGKKTYFKSITVSIIGMPNVGKSSVINSLCRNTHKLKTGNEPGVTRHLGRVKLTENILLIDTPGVIYDGDDDDPRSILRGCSKPVTDQAVVSCVELLVAELPLKLAEFYKCPADPLTTESLLTFLALSRGFIRPGGFRDLVKAGRVVIDDWKNGRFRYWVSPPAQSASVGQVHVVSTPSAPLDLDKL